MYPFEVFSPLCSGHVVGSINFSPYYMLVLTVQSNLPPGYANNSWGIILLWRQHYKPILDPDSSTLCVWRRTE